MTIPIQNIYYLLSYAWSRLEESAIVDVSGIPETRLVDLFARVLATGAKRLIRRGLDRGYLPRQEEVSCLRGRVDFDASLKRMLLERASASCVFDELSHDVLHNQILRSTIRRLVAIRELDPGLRRELLGVDRHLGAVSLIRLSRLTFRRLQIHRHNAVYGFLMQVCDLVFKNLLVDEATGEFQFRDFTRDENQMAALFEAFVLNFYRIERPDLDVRSELIAWDAEAADEESAAFLPSMRTDISIRSGQRTIIIDTKYYKETLQTHFNRSTVRSSNLYQLSAYLRNLEPRGGPDAKAEGILLYPVVAQSIDLRYRISGHEVRIFTIDLAQDWSGIHMALLRLIEPSAAL